MTNQNPTLEKINSVNVAQLTLTAEHLVKSCKEYDLYVDESRPIVNAITMLNPDQQTRGHYHDHLEYYHFDEPGLTLYVGGKFVDIVKPLVIEIEANCFHRVLNRTDKVIGFRCSWQAVDVKPTNYDESGAKQYDHKDKN